MACISFLVPVYPGGILESSSYPYKLCMSFLDEICSYFLTYVEPVFMLHFVSEGMVKNNGCFYLNSDSPSNSSISLQYHHVLREKGRNSSCSSRREDGFFLYVFAVSFWLAS